MLSAHLSSYRCQVVFASSPFFYLLSILQSISILLTRVTSVTAFTCEVQVVDLSYHPLVLPLSLCITSTLPYLVGNILLNSYAI
jgi:hypothetical protein